MARTAAFTWALLAGLFLTTACEDGDKGDDDAGSAGLAGGPGDDLATGSGGGNGSTGGSTGDGCEADVSPASLQRVYLAFAFDQSGSMGQEDYACHIEALKWDPVVAATKAFFGDTAQTGLSASLAFFPMEGTNLEKCDPVTYETPSVDMQPLPSPEFAAALEAVDTSSASAWALRGGTPTVPVLAGTLAYLEAVKAAHAGEDAKYVVVLVTDGMPSGCTGNDPDAVRELLADAAAEFPTFVIGVENPLGEGIDFNDDGDILDLVPNGGGTKSETCDVENLPDLDSFAVAGGTEKATLIETGDPAATQAAFEAAVEAIREQTVSCDITIPPPPDGQSTNPALVNVSLTLAGTSTPLAYDADCAAEKSWAFDDPETPTTIILCPDTCEAAKAPDASLDVEFGCERRDSGTFE